MSFAIHPSHPALDNNSPPAPEPKPVKTNESKTDTPQEPVKTQTISTKPAFSTTATSLIMHATGEIEDYY